MNEPTITSFFLMCVWAAQAPKKVESHSPSIQPQQLLLLEWPHTAEHRLEAWSSLHAHGGTVGHSLHPILRRQRTIGGELAPERPTT